MERVEDPGGVLVGAPADVLGVGLGEGDDPAALSLGAIEEASLADEEGGLLLGSGEGPLRFLGRGLDDPLALGIDPLRGADLVGDGDAELVDEIEDGLAIDDDALRERERLSGRDDRLEALQKEDDVQRRVLRAGDGGVDYRTPGVAQTSPSADRIAAAAAGGTMADTSPPNRAISFTRLELT